MYAWIWRHLPGPWPVKLAAATALLALVVAACFGWGFPLVADRWLAPSPIW